VTSGGGQWSVSSLFLLALAAGGRTFDLEGRLPTETRAAVYLHGATTPFSAAAVSDERGRFRFRKLAAGAYTVVVFIPGRGESRQTIDVGPGLADAQGRVSLVVQAKVATDDLVKRKNLISAKELSIPDKARREYDEAQRSLGRRDVEGAVAHLERAVSLAPQFAGAWNNLGTIAYQSRQFEKAEGHFRRALQEDPEAYEPAVNLGGVLLTLQKTDEALSYNQYSALVRPNDALANSQLGMNYFYLGDLERAVKYLKTAKELDPGHFSHPQLLLAEIYRRRQDPQAAAAEMEDFRKHHPDWSPVQAVPQP
jgi:tetratricopeptide (TPR) repeat protein